MSTKIMTAAEWKKCPTWHGSYIEYVRHMRGIQEYLAVASQHQSNEAG